MRRRAINNRKVHPLYRMIDANFNRAREAIRVLEDIARFILDSGPLQERLKALRHDLAEAARDRGLDPGLLIASRDTEGDVGTRGETTGLARSGVGDLAAANAARLSEALRAIEEACKALPAPDVARAIEQIRYRAYDLERDLRAVLPTGRARQWKLCVLITEALCVHHAWQTVAEEAIAGGADCLQLREKSLPDTELLARATWLVELTARAGDAHGTLCPDIIVNDRPDIALLAGANGVHLGQTDLPLPAVRRLAGTRLVIGVSCGTHEQAATAARQGADYLGLGPMFESTTKPKPSLAGPGLVERVTQDPLMAAMPHLAISGIDTERLPVLVRAGARGVAVSSAVCSSRDPRTASRAFVAALDKVSI